MKNKDDLCKIANKASELLTEFSNEISKRYNERPKEYWIKKACNLYEEELSKESLRRSNDKVFES